MQRPMQSSEEALAQKQVLPAAAAGCSNPVPAAEIV